jgi:hypothetical protein
MVIEFLPNREYKVILDYMRYLGYVEWLDLQE